MNITPRQSQVWALIAQGMCRKEIARTLGVAPATVKNHTHELFQRLGARNRTQAAAQWYRA